MTNRPRNARRSPSTSIPPRSRILRPASGGGAASIEDAGAAAEAVARLLRGTIIERNPTAGGRGRCNRDIWGLVIRSSSARGEGKGTVARLHKMAARR